MTKKCAKCDFEYDDVYDGCPACARAADIPMMPPPMPQASNPPVFTPAAVTDYGPGNAVGAVLSIVLVIVAGVFLSALTSGDARLWMSLLNGLLWAVVILVDYDSFKKPLSPGFRIAGTAGTSRGIWALAAFLIAIVAVPMYFYQRPRIRRAFELGFRPTVEGWYPDPTRRHESRYWVGSDWTAHVSDGGIAGSDPRA